MATSRRITVQTLKTAAIVVLLMTVLYAGYISLTTPPDSLPAEVEQLVMDDSEFNIETGLPDSLDSLGIDSGTPSENDAFASGGSFTDHSMNQGQNNQSPINASPNQSFAPETQPTFGSSFADIPQRSSPDAQLASSRIASIDGGTSSGVSASFSDENLTIRQPSSDESRTPSHQINGIASKGVDGYPSTDMTFDLPDPNSVSLDDPTAGGLDVAGQSPTAVDSIAPMSGDEVSQVAALSSQSAAATSNNIGLANAIKVADTQYEKSQRKEALATLSLFYNTPGLTSAERSQLLSRLDPLAGEVIYSQSHLLEQPHRVGQSETMMEIAIKYEVPWQLLANINGIDDPITVLPGTELKVVKGPFRAEVDLTKSELTLFLGDLYAGRFPVSIGTDPVPKPGTFTVQDKQAERTYYDAAGSPVPSGSPNNPYGDLWLDLGSQLSIHGSPYATKPSDQGCISVAGDFADDLFGILSQGSSVTIRR